MSCHAAPPDVAASLVDGALRRWPDALVADVASVKTTVLEGLRRLARPEDLPRYVGAHPMAGREVSGVIAAAGGLGGYFPPLVMGATYNPEHNSYFFGLMLLAAFCILGLLVALVLRNGGKVDQRQTA